MRNRHLARYNRKWYGRSSAGDKMRPSSVLVIGATGFIGRALVAELASSGIPRIKATSRRITKDAYSQYKTVECLPSDVMEIDSLVSAMAYVDVVIDCYRDDRTSLLAINNVLRACVARGVKRLVYLSSIAAYGEASDIVSEDTPPAEPISGYGRAKLSAENACRSEASDALKIAIVRPSLVYGPGGEEWSLRFIRTICNGRLLRLGKMGEGTANLVNVYDLAKFCVELGNVALPMVSVYNVNGTSAQTFNEYFLCIAKALEIDTSTMLGRPDRLHLARARRLGRGGVRIMRRLAAPLVGHHNHSNMFSRLNDALQPGPEDVALAGGYRKKVYYSPARAQSIGFSQQVSLDEGVRSSVDWARRNELIKLPQMHFL
jgi:2-alkyl-3-oxoalkanoate reductase